MSAFDRFRINIKYLIEEERITLSELAKRAGLSRSLVYGYLEGKNVPSIEQIQKIADALVVSVASLIGDAPPNPPKIDLAIEQMKLAAIAGIMSLDSREDLESILDALKPFLNRASKKSQRRATGP